MLKLSIALKSIIFLLLLLVCSNNTGFTDDTKELSMEDCIRLGLQNNKDMSYVQEDLQIQMMSLNEKYRKFFPHVSVSYGDNNEVYYNYPDSKSKIATVGLSQMIYDGDKLKRDVEETKIGIQLAVLENQQKRMEYLFQVVNGYLNLLKLEEKLKLKQEFLSNQLKEWTVTEKKFELGEATKLDVYEWEIQLNQTKIDGMELENNLRMERLSYNRLLGISAETAIHLTQKLNTDALLQVFDLNEEEVRQNALVNSTDLKKVQLSINKARYSSVKNNMFLPDVSLNASYTTTPPNRMFRPSDSWNVGLTFTFPFFFDKVNYQTELGGTFSGNQRNMTNSVSSTVYEDPSFTRQLFSEDVSMERLGDQYRTKQEDIKISVIKFISDIQFQREKLKMLDDKIKLSEEKSLIMGKQVMLGENKISDYVTFLNSLNSSKVDRLDSIYNYTASLVSLLKVQGRLSDEAIRKFYNEFLVEVKYE